MLILYIFAFFEFTESNNLRPIIAHYFKRYSVQTSQKGSLFFGRKETRGHKPLVHFP